MFRRINEAINIGEERTKQIALVSEAHQKQKLRLFQDLVSRNTDDPTRETAIDDQLKWIDLGTKKIGRPKNRWAQEAAKKYWKESRGKLPQRFQHAALDLEDHDHIYYIQLYAYKRFY